MGQRSRAPAATFHDPPPEGGKYKSAIKRAKAATKDKPGALEGTPHFDALPEPEKGPPPGVVQKEELSPKTVSGLTALQQAQEQHKISDETLLAEMAESEKKEEDPYEGLLPAEIQSLKLKKAVEERIDPIDISPYFVGGSVTQMIPIIPDKFLVKFRTVTDLEETYVDHALVEEGELSTRQFLRRTNEWGLATHIEVLNGTRWPAIFDGDGTISEKAIEIRMRNVRLLPSPVFNLLTTNLQWFLDRVNDSLNLEALGNG